MNRLKELRIKRNLTQIALARALGFSQGGISKIERGEQIMTADEIKAYSKYFDVSVEYILNLTDKKRNSEINVELNKRLEKYLDFLMILDSLPDGDKDIIFVLTKHLDNRRRSTVQAN